MSNKKPMSVTRRATLWKFDGYYEQESKHFVTIFEPLETDAPKDASPYIYLRNHVDFYKPNGNDKYDENVECRDLVDVAPVLLNIEGTWYERHTGRIIWKDDWECWCLAWYCNKKSRMACMLNYGQPAWKQTELVLGNWKHLIRKFKRYLYAKFQK
jgi:hypothetical protein